MNMRRFEFPATPDGKTDFHILNQAFRGVDPDKATGEERAYLAAAQRVINSASDPIGDPISEADGLEGLTIDVRPRALKHEGATIEVSQKLHEKVEAWVTGAKFHPLMSAAVEDFRDRWGQAEKFVKDDTAPRPVGVVKKK